MRIEKISENQIRCTLDKKDLSDREIGISELAYGTPKTRALFRDMMRQASYEVGFVADDIPLMIEAIPMAPESLVLVITKVEDPEELDTRFSCFTEEQDWVDYWEGKETDYYDEESGEEEEEEDEEEGEEDEVDEGFDLLGVPLSTEVADCPDPRLRESDFVSLPEVLGAAGPQAGLPDLRAEKRPVEKKTLHDVTMIFSFPNLDSVSTLAESIYPYYYGKNTLYKDESSGIYYLVVHRSDHDPAEFNRISNYFFEFGTAVRNNNALPLYYEEHYRQIIADRAIQVLAEL